MCNPAAVVMAIQAAQQVQSYRQEAANAQTQNDWQRLQFESNKDFALADFRQEQELTRRREAEEQALLDADVERITAESTRVRGTAAVTAAESGATGGAVTSVINDFLLQEINYRDTISRRKEAIGLQADESLKAAHRTTRARIAGAQQPEAIKPNFSNLLLGIGGSSLGTFNQFYKWDKASSSWIDRD